MKLEVIHTIAVPVDVLWNFHHSPAFEAYFPPKLGLSEYREVERKDNADHLYRKLKITPTVPSGAQKLLQTVVKGASLSYEETTKKYKNRYYLEWGTLLPVMQDKISISGTLEFSALDAKSCRRVLKGDVNVKILGIGGQVEKMIISGVTDSYTKMVGIMEEYARANGLA